MTKFRSYKELKDKDKLLALVFVQNELKGWFK